MKTISWNCRGLGNQATVRALQKILQLHRPEIVFLMETRRTATEMRYLNQTFFKYCGCMAVDCVGSRKGRSGGITMLWNNNIDLQLITFSSNHILLMAKGESMKENWFMSGIYGWPEVENRWRTWALLGRIQRSPTEAWCCMGDMNEIMWSTEKQGGRPRSYTAMKAFREAIENAQLQEIHCPNQIFTWSNNRPGKDNIREKLDRIFINDGWKQMFPSNQIDYLPRYKSDHAPIVFTFDMYEVDVGALKRKKTFRFEEMWVRHPDFNDLLENTWNNLPTDLPIHKKMKSCGETLRLWNDSTFGSVKKKLRDLNEQLDKLQMREQSEDTLQKSRTIERELDEIQKREEIMWKQRARMIWLKEGDRNTKFFHEKQTKGTLGIGSSA